MFKRILQTFKYSIFPSKCLVCGKFFHSDPNTSEKPLFHCLAHAPTKTVFHQEMAPFLCPTCIDDLSPIRSPFCTQCGHMFKTDSGTNHQCWNCIQNKTVCHMIRSAGIYNGALKSAIHELKYKNGIHLARPLGRLLFSSFMKYYDMDEMDCIIPIPLHVSRLRQRGFNQAMMLIDEWPRLIDRYKPSWQIITDKCIHIDLKNLVRNQKTVSQTGLGRKERKKNVKGAFAVTDTSKIAGKQILLVDDVYTTGSTCHECAKTLIANKAKSVSVLTLARAN